MNAPPLEDEGPMARKLRELWLEARTRVYRPGYLFKTLRLRRQFDLRFLHPHQVTVDVPKGQVPDCEECVDICCTGPNAVVSLRLIDIARLADANLSHNIQPGPGAADMPQALSTRLPVVSQARTDLKESVFSRVFPVLTRDVTATCTLLSEDRTCGAFPAWPLSCSRYPYAVDQVRRRVFWAEGCESHQQLPASQTTGQVRNLVEAALASYNERIKDIVLLHVALPELHALGFFPWLRFEGPLAREAERVRGSRRHEP